MLACAVYIKTASCNYAGWKLRVMPLPSSEELAAELMSAFGPDGPKRGKPLTQILEHAELVYLTVQSESPDNWRTTSLGLATPRGGKDAVRQRISGR